MMTLSRFWLPTTAWTIIVLALLPLAIVAGSSLTTASYVSFPPVGLGLEWYERLLRRGDLIGSFQLSVMLAVATAVLATIIGTAAAMAITRYSFPGRTALSTLWLSPLMVPTVVIGLALLVFISSYLGMHRSVFTLLAGHLVISVPFVIRLVGASLAGLDENIEKAARSLGAGPFTVFRRITLPGIKRGVAAGALLAGIVSFDDVSIALFLSTPGMTTFPIRLFTEVEQNNNPIVPAASTVTILLTIAALFVIERVLGVRRVYQLPGALEEAPQQLTARTDTVREDNR